MALGIQNQIYIIIGVFGGITLYLFIHLLILHSQFVNYRRKVKKANILPSNTSVGGPVQQPGRFGKTPDPVENNNSSNILAARGYSSYTGNSNLQMTPSALNQQQQPLSSFTRSFTPSNRPGGGNENSGFYNQQQQQQRWSGRNPMSNNNGPSYSQQQQRQQNGQQNEMFGAVQEELMNEAADQAMNAAMDGITSGEFAPELPSDYGANIGQAALKDGTSFFGKFGGKNKKK